MPGLKRVVRNTASLVTLALALSSTDIFAQTRDASAKQDAAAQPKLGIRIAQAVPPGFENIDNSIETLFDIYISGRRVGTANARVANGRVTFRDPAALVALLPDRVDREKALALLSQSLSSNEALRCLPGRSADCGTLPSGEAGVIVNPEQFSVEIILTEDYFTAPLETDNYLGEPVKTPSLIQNALVSVSTGASSGSGVRLGASLNTLASLGRTSFVGQTFVRDKGVNIQQAYAQHFWNNRSADAGLLLQSASLTFNSYRLVGAEFGSFFGSRRDAGQGQQTPIEVLLPRAAQVEIYRDGLLIQATHLEAGLQRINTSNFPSGSYTVRIVAKDGAQILVDETRVFTRVADLPPGKALAFHVRAGLRVSDLDQSLDNVSADRPFLPHVTNQPVLSASATKRIGAATALTGELLMVDNRAFVEGAAVTYRGNVNGLAAVAVGSEGSYSALVSGTAHIARIDFNLTARRSRLGGRYDPVPVGPSADDFRPFYRSEDTVTASMGFQALGGNLSLNGSYSRSPFFPSRYVAGARYTRSFLLRPLGEARMSVFALKSKDDARVGLTLTFSRRLNRKTILTYAGGAEYRSRSDVSDGADGLYPVADVRVSRQDRLGTIDLNSQAGVSVDSTRNRAFVSTNLASNLGTFDATADYEDSRIGSSGVGLTANIFSGFVVGGGKVKLGIRDPNGDAAMIVAVDRPTQANRIAGDEGRYRIILGNQFVGSVKPGASSALMLPSFREYRVALQPEGSPPYTLDLSQRVITLYPGNVAVLDYKASQQITIFGRLISASGKPLPQARVAGPVDTTITDDHGYFILSAAGDDRINFYDEAHVCLRKALNDLVKRVRAATSGDYVPVGDVQCVGGQQDDKAN